jgi:hypothetical protein
MAFPVLPDPEENVSEYEPSESGEGEDTCEGSEVSDDDVPETDSEDELDSEEESEEHKTAFEAWELAKRTVLSAIFDQLVKVVDRTLQLTDHDEYAYDEFAQYLYENFVDP